MQLKSQKVNKKILFKKAQTNQRRNNNHPHSLVFAILAWPFENKGNFYCSFWLVFKCFFLMFCTELKLNAKVCPSNAVIQTRGKTPSLPAFQIMVQYNGNPSKEGFPPLSWRGLSCHPVPAPYSVQESVIFLLRNQITFLLVSNVFKVFFPATSLLCHTHALCFSIAQTMAADKIQPATLISLKSNQLYIMQSQEQNWQTSPLLPYFKKYVVFWLPQHSTWLYCFYSYGLGRQSSFNFSPPGPCSLILSASKHRVVHTTKKYGVNIIDRKKKHA